VVSGCVCGLHARTCAGANDITIRVALDTFGLTPRELDVARCLAVGDSNKEISRALVIACSTVKAHIEAILGKTHTDNRTRAALVLAPYLGRNL